MSQEFDFNEPVELQEWYDIGSDIRIAIRKQFSGLVKQFNQLKSQLEEKDAEIARLTEIVNKGGYKLETPKEVEILKERIAELESSLRLLTLKAQSESEIQSLKQQLESARGVISGYADGTAYKTNRQIRGEVLFDYAASSLLALQWLEENK